MTAYTNPTTIVNPSFAEFSEPVWTYARRTRWAGALNPNYHTGRWAKVRHRIERQVEGEDRWLSGFLCGDAEPHLAPLARAVCQVIRTGYPPGLRVPTPGWVHEARARVERALTCRPAPWWAVPAPSAETPPPKARATWWVPRASWGIATLFVGAVRALRRYLIAVYRHTVRQVTARRQAEQADAASRCSDQPSDHPVPQRIEKQQEGGFASRKSDDGLAEVLARVLRQYGPQAEEEPR